MIKAIIVFVSLLALAYANIESEDAIVLIPHGEDPAITKNRIVIPQIKDGPQPPLPCIMADSGTHEHGQTFRKGNFHYRCNNGTAEVIACVAEDMSVIQIGRTFIRNGIRHKCNVDGETVTYEQKSTCFENGVHYDVGESFRNGSFKLACKDNGVAIEGCYLKNRTTDVIRLGESVVIGQHRHTCEILAKGKVRYTVNVLGCRRDQEVYSEGQIWTDKHIRYQCTETGTTKVLGCIDDGGLFIDLGRDILIQGVVHRCYRINNTTFYHRFNCENKSLHECVNNAPTPKRVRSLMNRA
uniref:Abnormal cell migration protein 18-like fibronectin type I domain-containing protein n=1 Tax=Acrobeloides nanus TaxID=290746 RepID=A0A914C4U4_9BILA